jgi:hypothetical protein
MWTRLALYAVLGYTLDALGAHWDTWGFWCVLGLFWAAEHLTRMEVIRAIELEVEELKKRRSNSND